MATAAKDPSDSKAKPDSGESKTTWQFNADDKSAPSAADVEPSSGPSVSWTASEYIAHAKGSSWYLLLAISTVVIAGIIYLLTRSIFNTAIIVIAGGIFGFMAGRQPRELPYIVDGDGIQIGPKQFKYSVFRSFSIVQEGAIESIWFMPLKRLMPIITIYFEPPDQEKIVNVISQHLPVENHQLDAVDKFMHKIRF